MEENEFTDKLKDALSPMPEKALKITQRGLKVLMRADMVHKGIPPDEIKLLSALRNGKKHPLSEFGREFFNETTLEKCVKYLKKEMFILETLM